MASPVPQPDIVTSCQVSRVTEHLAYEESLPDLGVDLEAQLTRMCHATVHVLDQSDDTGDQICEHMETILTLIEDQSEASIPRTEIPVKELFRKLLQKLCTSCSQSEAYLRSCDRMWDILAAVSRIDYDCVADIVCDEMLLDFVESCITSEETRTQVSFLSLLTSLLEHSKRDVLCATATATKQIGKLVGMLTVLF